MLDLRLRLTTLTSCNLEISRSHHAGVNRTPRRDAGAGGQGHNPGLLLQHHILIDQSK